MNPLEIKLKTLTPIWTGGAETGQMDRLHETGIIGSLRWWYEAIVRGLGGNACDPASENSCQFNTKAYEKAKREKDPNAIEIGLADVCPACRLFGCTGWRRLFTLRVVEAPTVAFHLRTSLNINKNWFERSFPHPECEVAYGAATFQLIVRGQDLEFVYSQLALLFTSMSQYAGIGAKQQHGFGQFDILSLPKELQEFTVEDNLSILASKIKRKNASNTPFNLDNLVHLEYEIPSRKLSAFLGRGIHYGSSLKKNEQAYIPCAFDLRYKGNEPYGFRRWLKKEKGWKESNREDELGDLDKLMGPRSQWGKNPTKYVKNELRTASRVFFGMPYQQSGDVYHLCIFGFAPPELLTPSELSELLKAYMKHVFDLDASKTMNGADLMAGKEMNA